MTGPPRNEHLDRPATSDSTARALVAAIPDPIFRIGTDGVYRGFKVDSERDLLTSADNVIGHTVHERLPADIAEMVLAAGRKAVAEGELQHIEYSLDVEGESREYEGRLVACGPDEFVFIVRDFTAQRRQARELERERDFSYAVVRSTPSFLALVDEERDAARHQSGARAHVGHPGGDVDRATVLGALHRRARTSRAPRRTSFDSGTTTRRGSSSTSTSRPTGERLVVDWTATVVHDAEDRLRYLLCGLDVTARKQVEEEIRRSRARIISASDTERKRLERNLHDGAQQHLVSVSHAVHMGLRLLDDDPRRAEDHFQRALVELNAAHEELRELARGLHPQILTVQGLAVAVRSLARRAPIPVTVITIDDAQRWHPLVESAAYYVVAEALTNVLKYSDATIGHHSRPDP